MRSGNRRHSIVLEQPSESVVAGENKTAFKEFARTRAAVRALSGRELFAAQQVQAEVTTVINFRWRPGIHEALRIVVLPEGTVYGILAVLPDKTGRREIDCLCVKRTSEGWRDGGGE